MFTRLPALLLGCLWLVSCEPAASPDGAALLEPPRQPPRTHALVGAWLAGDGTIFHFREDGTFHGIDFRKREIWGNWVTLSEERIGFQSLLHDASYKPQYAIIAPDSRDRMDYIVTNGTHFISARRIPTADAVTAIRLVVEPNVHRPKAE